LYLSDSGGQYGDGTTDITRTVVIGRPDREQRRAFTLVLKGHIGIATARFPKGTRGMDIDVLARIALWQYGMDYAHGTGHGVGSYLSVHEGPQNISKRGTQELLPGMIISNEPGYYRAGEFGIRIENLVLVREAARISDGDTPMLGFETLTLCPIDQSLIDPTMLTDDELHWLNAYHGWVRRELTPLVNDNVAEWLRRATEPMVRNLPPASA
ncbi:MAG: M24 family metallopeptidase, partial [Rhizobiaceae bacterium]